jgi:hypothetical protein
MSKEDIGNALSDIIDLAWCTAWEQGQLDGTLTGGALTLYREELEALCGPIVALEAENQRLREALLGFKSQYSLSPWIINQVDNALKGKDNG